jgi:OOP family OmpA-OmpF porin
MTLFSIAALGLGFASSAMAADEMTGYYVGGNVGQSRTKIDTASFDASVRALGVATSTTSANQNDTGFKLFGGYRFHPNFAVEAGYFNIGKFTTTTVTTGPGATVVGSAQNNNGFNIDLVAIAPLDAGFSLFGRFCIQTSKTSLSAAGFAASRTAAISSNETSAGYKAGLGAQYDFTKSVGARAEWERYRVPGGGSGVGKADVDLFSLGMVVRF